jgi:WD40 repeat protein
LGPVAAGGSLTLWDLSSRSRLHGPLSAGGGTVLAGGLSFSPDGATLATVSELGVRLWDVATGAGLGTIGSGEAGNLALSADGAMIAFARPDRGGAEIWDAATRTLIVAVDGSLPPFCDLSVALSPDGRMLAVGGFEPVASLWDVGTGTHIGPQLTAGTAGR